MMTATERKEIAMTILNQLGGIGTLVMMTGAKDFVTLESGVQFKIGKNATSANLIRIELTPADTYTLKIMRVRGTTVSTMAQYEDVYADSLGDLITTFTGLYLTFR